MLFPRQEWARLDRPYCSSDLFRQLILDNVSATEADCRTSIRERIHKCNREVCPQCNSPCNFPVARTIAEVFRCMDGTRHFGFLWYYQVSDAGQLARSMHGARRKDGFKPVPEKLAAVRDAPSAMSTSPFRPPFDVCSQHLYYIAHYNPKGYVQRDCKLRHSNSIPSLFLAHALLAITPPTTAVEDSVILAHENKALLFRIALGHQWNPLLGVFKQLGLGT